MEYDIRRVYEVVGFRFVNQFLTVSSYKMKHQLIYELKLS